MHKRKVKKARQKRSMIWLGMPDHDFVVLVAKSRHIGDILNAFGLENVGRNHYTAYDRIRALKLDTAHFNARNRSYGERPRPLSELLVVGSRYSGVRLKARLLASETLVEVCALCSNGPTWRGARLVLRLDHINGERRDNRLENLRLLCPNCDSQTETFCGRNNRRKRLLAEAVA